MNPSDIPVSMKGHDFRMLQDSEHYKKDDVVWSADFTGMTKFTVGGREPDRTMVEISGTDQTPSGETRPEEVHCEMLDYIGISD